MATRVDVRVVRTDTFQRVVANIGNSAPLRAAMALGLNEHLRKQQRQASLVIAAQTGIARGRVDAGSGVRFASAGNLEGAVQQRGRAAEAGEFTSRTWNRWGAGARHRDWPTYSRKGGMMAGTFMANGKIYRRTTAKRFPIKRVWGPVLPNELLRADMPAKNRAEGLAASDLQRSVVRAIMHSFGF